MAVSNTALAQKADYVLTGMQVFMTGHLHWLTATVPTVTLTNPYTLVETTVKTPWQLHQDYDAILNPISGSLAQVEAIVEESNELLEATQQAQTLANTSAATAVSKAAEAAASAIAADASADGAETFRNQASSSASNASASASSASASASTATAGAATATTGASESSGHAAAAAASAAAAAASAAASALSAGTAEDAQEAAEAAQAGVSANASAAAGSASGAAGSASAAAASASNASASASTATTKAGEASISASNASGSATDANAAKTAAELARDQAQAAAGATQPFVGATGATNGVQGLVPAPQIADRDKLLIGSGVWSDQVAKLGVGVSPRTWDDAVKSLQVGTAASVYGSSSRTTGLAMNVYQSASGWKHIAAAVGATLVVQSDGRLEMQVTSSPNVTDGTATFSTAFSISPSGRAESKSLRVTDYFPASTGVGVEIGYLTADGIGFISAYDRAGAFKKMNYNGSEHVFLVNGGETAKFGGGLFSLTSASTNSTYILVRNTAASGRSWSVYSSGGGPAAAGSFGVYDETGGGTRLLLAPDGASGTFDALGLDVVKAGGVSRMRLGNSTQTYGIVCLGSDQGAELSGANSLAVYDYVSATHAHYWRAGYNHAVRGYAYHAEYDNGSSGGINWASNGTQQKITLTGNTTITMTAPPKPCYVQLKVATHASAGTSHTITWPASVKWAGRTVPNHRTGNSHTHLFRFWFDGSNYLGSMIPDFG